MEKIKNYSLKGFVLRIFESVYTVVTQFLSLCFLKFKCIMHGAQYGKKLDVFGRVIIRGPGKIVIGDCVQFISSSWRCTAASLSTVVKLRTFSSDSEIIIGAGAGFNGTSITARSRRISIGKNTIFAPDCIVMDSDFHVPWPPTDRNNNPGFEYDQDITIGNNVWVGSRCIILKGVTIGDNTVIAAGSVVTSNIPGNTLAGGIPAKVIKQYAVSE